MMFLATVMPPKSLMFWKVRPCGGSDLLGGEAVYPLARS